MIEQLQDLVAMVVAWALSFLAILMFIHSQIPVE